jgi:hypothetical protein
LDSKVKAAVTREWNKRCGKALTEKKEAEEDDAISDVDELDAP